MQALHTGSIYLVDSVDYLSQAHNLAEHNSLYAAPWEGPFRFDYFTFRPPVYGIFILLCRFISSSDYLVLLIQSGLSLLTISGFTRLAQQQAFDMGRVRFFLLLMLICYPSQLIHCNFIMSDILFQCLLFYAFYFSYRLVQHTSYRNAFAAVILFMLAMLTKPVAFLLGISLMVVLLFILYRKQATRYLLPFLLLPLTYHAWCSYNRQVTGYYHYTSVTPVFVLKYMAKYTNAQLYGETYADSVQDEVMVRVNAQRHFKDRYELMNGEGKKIIGQHVLFFAWFNIKGWFAFMLDPGRFEWVHFLNLDEGAFPGLYHVVNTQGLVKGLFTFIMNAPLLLLFILVMAFAWNVVVSALFVVFLFYKKIPWTLRLWVFLFVAYIVVSTGVLGLSRYRVAVAPMLWLAAIYVLHRIIARKEPLQSNVSHAG